MEYRTKPWFKGLVAASAVFPCGLALAQGLASTDPPGPPVDAPRAEKIAQSPSPGSRALIVHALTMAIEGSTLQGLSQQALDLADRPVARDVRGMRMDTRAAESNRTTRTPEGLNNATAPNTGDAGMGTTGSPAGDAGSGGNTYGRDPSPPVVRTPVNSGQPVTDAGVVPVERRFANRTMRSPNEIRQHARNAFAASDRLLRQAADDPSVERFYRAANRYIATLKTLSEPAFRAGESGDVVPTAPNPADIISIGLINHGVKEALDALALKQLVLLMKADTPEGRTLLDHAQKMDAESRQAIDSVDRLEAVTDLNPAGRALPAGNQLGVVVTNTGGSNGAGVRMLADQSRELLQTIRELDRGTTVERQR